MPLLAHGIDHTALDGPSAGTADGDTHLIMAGQTVQLPLQLPGISSQLFTAEMKGNWCIYKAFKAHSNVKDANDKGVFVTKKIRK